MHESSPVIDAYCHCGIQKYRPLVDVLAAMDGAGVDRAVLVQHLGEFDNDYIGDAVDAHPDRFTGVCLVDHRQPDAIETLERKARDPRFEGVRLQIQHIAEAEGLYHAAAELGMNIVLCTIGGLHPWLDGLEKFLADHAGDRLVLTHWGWPRVEEAPGFSDYRRVLALSRYPGVVLQLSGLGMFAESPYEAFRPAIDLAFEAFGSERLLWGSNFPVSGKTIEGYAAELDAFRAAGLSSPERSMSALLFENAARIWFEGSR